MLLRSLLAAVLAVGTVATLQAEQLVLRPADPDTARTSAPVPRTATVLETPDRLPSRLRGMGSSIDIVVPTVDGSMTLTCAPFDVLTPEAVVVAATANGDVPFDAPDHVMLRGVVAGVPGSYVFIAAFETHMTAIVELPGPDGKQRWMLMPDSVMPGRRSALVMMPTPTVLGTPVRCFSEDVPGNAARADSIFMAVASNASSIEKNVSTTQRNDRYAVQVALECAKRFFDRHNGNLTLSAQYAITLLGASSAVYQRDANIQLLAPFLRIWTETDPYPGDMGAALGGIRDHWNNTMGHVQRSVAMLLSVDLGGGLAYVGVLCGGYGYNVSSVGGNVNFPASGYIWDIDVTSHELGHNIGSSHTHNCGWNPPIDSCWNAEGGCYDATRPQRGTIMSYCHLQNKGTELQFHARVASLFRSVVERTACAGPVRDVVATDVGTIAISMPSNGGIIGTKAGFRPSVLVRNTGRQPMADITCTCRILTLKTAEKRVLVQTIAALAPGETRSVSFEALSIDSAGDYLMEVTSTAVGDQNRSNDQLTRPFRVSTAVSGAVRVVSPNGGETLRCGSKVTVRWTATGVTRARLAYSTDDGGSWSTVRFNVDATAGQEEWTVPFTPTSTARLRVISLDNAQSMDASDATFRIVADTDLAVVDIIDPDINGTVPTPFTPRIIVYNQGATDVRNATLRLAMRWVRMNDHTYDTTITIPFVAAGDSDTVVMPATPVMASGAHVVEAYVSARNDINPENDRLWRSFTSIGLSPPSDATIEEGDHHVVLRWQVRDVNDSNEIEIHVRGADETSFRLLRRVAATVNTYVAESPNGDSVAYRLFVRRGARLSSPSQTLMGMPRRFPYGAVLTAPRLLGPVGAQRAVPMPLDLTWSDVPGADQYEVQLAKDRDFRDLVRVYVTRTDGVQTVPGAYGATWWWRVRAIDPSMIGPWSEPTSFTVTTNCAGKALAFTASNAASQADITWNGGPVTVEFWQYVRSSEVRNSTAFMIGENDNTRNRFQTHAPWSDRRLYWDYGNVDDKGRLSVDYGPRLDKWTHVALVSNGVDFKAIYFDGELVASENVASAPTGLKRLTLGGMVNSLFHAGTIDEVRLWKVARTADQIRASMHRRQPPASELRDLAGMWRFDDQSNGTVARDISGQNKPLSLPDASLWSSSAAPINCDDMQTLPGIILSELLPDTAPRMASMFLDLPKIPNAQWTDVVVLPQGGTEQDYVFRAFNVADNVVRLGTLAPNTSYVVRVRAHSATAVGPWAEAVMTTPPACDSTVAKFDQLPTVFIADTFRFDGRAVTVEYWNRVQASEKRNASIFSLGQFENGAYRAQAHSPWSDDNLYFDWGAFNDVGRLRTSYANAFNTWTHVALVSDGVDEMQIFLDGRRVARSSFAGRIDTATRLVIGGNTFGGTLHRGQMADLRLWNVPLTEERIRERMHERIADVLPSLVGSFPLDEGSGTSVVDAVQSAVATAAVDSMWTQSERPVYHVYPSIRVSRTAHRQDTATYVIRTRPGMSVQWKVSGGTIVDGQGTASIVVRWDSSATAGTISVVRTFAGGCVDSARMDVDVQPFVSVGDVADVNVVVRPNPAYTTCTIESPIPIREVRVVDAVGASVLVQTAYDRLFVNLDLHSMATGVYHLQIVTSRGTLHRNLVVQR